jgi:hypothetical protein
MSGSANVQVLGINDAIRSLNKIEPGLRKQFNADATRIAQPAIQEAQQRYDQIAWGQQQLRGVSRNWNNNGRRIFPFNLSKARNGLKVKLDADRRRTATILLEQRDAATAILESAGRKNPGNPLAVNMKQIEPGHTRVLAPALWSKKAQVQSEMEAASLKVVQRVQRELNR